MNDQEPLEPTCPPGRAPHRERVERIALGSDDVFKQGKIAGVCIDNTPEHIAWYLHELAKYPNLEVVKHGALNKDLYVIQVLRAPY